MFVSPTFNFGLYLPSLKASRSTWITKVHSSLCAVTVIDFGCFLLQHPLYQWWKHASVCVRVGGRERLIKAINANINWSQHSLRWCQYNWQESISWIQALTHPTVTHLVHIRRTAVTPFFHFYMRAHSGHPQTTEMSHLCCMHDCLLRLELSSSQIIEILRNKVRPCLLSPCLTSVTSWSSLSETLVSLLL